MALFKDGIQLTPQGKALHAKALLGDLPLAINAIAVGDGPLNTQVDPNSLANELFRYDKSSGKVKVRRLNAVVVVFEIDFSDYAAQSSVAWQFRELGIFAEDPDYGEILYAYANAGENYDTIPPQGANTYLHRKIQIPIEVANAANVIINITTITDITGENIGGDNEVYAGVTGNNMQFRTLKAGNGIIIQQEGDNIIISMA
jgi:hypothetical protein